MHVFCSCKWKMMSLLMLALCFPFVSSATTLSIPCPRSCDCSHVSRYANEKILEITCFVWDIKDVIGRSLSIVQEDFKLKIVCDSGIPADLDDYMFGYLPLMKSFTFENCKISYVHKAAFSGLTSLHSLYIHSASNLHLQLHPDVFSDIMKISTLVITGSGLSQLPELCALSDLKVLNLSDNSLVTFRDAGLDCSGNRTLTNLRVIDISNNYFQSVKELKDYGLSFTDVEIFYAVNNQIKINIDENPFGSFVNLRLLDLSRNQITELPKGLLASNKNIEELRIAANNLDRLPTNIFQNCSRLLQLDLHENVLDDSVWLELAPLNKLMFLDVSDNKLTYLNQTTMAVLPELTYLDMTGNLIQNIPIKTFQNQQSLRHLSVARNMINTLDNEALYGLLSLTRLDLQQNRIYSINRNVFNALSALTQLNISYNYLQDLPSLDKLSSLTVFDVRQNFIQTISETLFIGTSKIIDINLSNNRITELPDAVFRSCNLLEKLDLSNNLIQNLHPSLFIGLDIQILSLHNNRLQDFGKMFATLDRLRELNLSSNEITDTLQRFTFPANLIMLDLSYNKIEHIRPFSFDGLSRIRMIDLRFNRISTLSKDALTVSTGLYAQTAFRLEHNSLKCDCNLVWLKNWNQETHGPIIVNLNVTKCSGAYDYPESNIKSVPEERFLCKYDSVCTDGCKCCDFLACDCKYNCPVGCSCYRSADYYTNHYIKCSSRYISTIDKFVPRIVTELDYSGSDLSDLESLSFIGMSNLQTLLLNSSNIQNISNGSFTGLTKLRTLRLNDNLLITIRNGIFEGLENLENLYLDNNKISEIQNMAFEGMTALKKLSITNNFMFYMTDYISELVFKIEDVSLYSNPWKCDCILYFSARDKAAAFLNEKAELRHSFSKINCSVPAVDGPGHITPLQGYKNICEGRKDIPEIEAPIEKLVYPDELPNTAEVIDTQDKSHDTETGSDVISKTFEGSPLGNKMQIFIPAIVAGTLLFIIILMALCRREFVKCWLFTKYKCKANDLELLYDKTRFYDAFIAYHPRDELYVVRELALKLERGEPKYLLQLQHRDCPSGTAPPNFIENSVKSSHRTIVVLSSEYVTDNMSLKLVLDSVKLDSVRRLIVVVLDKIDKTKIDPVLQNLIQNEKCVRYGERWFWEKLQFYLPEPGKVERDIARAEVHPYACAELTRLSSAMRDNQAYEEPFSMNSGTCRPLPLIVDYNPPSLQSYDYTSGSQTSSNIYEEIKDHENTSIKYLEPWTESQLQTNVETLSRAVKA